MDAAESVGDDASAGRAPSVSVIVPHYSGLRDLDLCLSALMVQTYDAGPFEIIVADNASPEGLAKVEAVVAGRARVEVVRERGAGPARNGGVKASAGAILAFTDADCVPDPDWLKEGLAALRDADCVGGRVRVSIELAGRPTPVEAFEAVFAFDNETYVVKKGFSVTANLFCSRAVFEAVGEFRTGVPEDLEWCARARGQGFSLRYAGRAVVWHPARRTWDELVRKWRRLNAEAFGQSRDERKVAKWAVRAALLPVSAILHTPKVLFTSELSGLQPRLGALAVLYRIRLWRVLDAFRLLRERANPSCT